MRRELTRVPRSPWAPAVMSSSAAPLDAAKLDDALRNYRAAPKVQTTRCIPSPLQAAWALQTRTRRRRDECCSKRVVEVSEKSGDVKHGAGARAKRADTCSPMRGAEAGNRGRRFFFRFGAKPGLKHAGAVRKSCFETGRPRSADRPPQLPHSTATLRTSVLDQTRTHCAARGRQTARAPVGSAAAGRDVERVRARNAGRWRPTRTLPQGLRR